LESAPKAQPRFTGPLTVCVKAGRDRLTHNFEGLLESIRYCWIFHPTIQLPLRYRILTVLEAGGPGKAD
jgi:hypothetical protein